MDLDLANVRAFVATATELHFGRAAGSLFLSQQGLSKRIGRLEASLGVTLFVRGPGRVTLTDAGQRFLPHARRLLELADVASTAAQPDSARPLRVDVWGHVQQPMRLVQDALARGEDMRVDLSMRRSATESIAALEKWELDIAFANVGFLDEPVPGAIDHQLISCARMSLVASVDHPFSSRTQVTAAELRGQRLWWPVDNAPEVRGWFQRFARDHAIEVDLYGQSLGYEHIARAVAEDSGRVALYGSAWPLPTDAAVRVVPIVNPVVLYPWSVLWLRVNTHPRLAAFIAQLIAVAQPWRDAADDDAWTGLPANS